MVCLRFAYVVRRADLPASEGMNERGVAVTYSYVMHFLHTNKLAFPPSGDRSDSNEISLLLSTEQSVCTTLIELSLIYSTMISRQSY